MCTIQPKSVLYFWSYHQIFLTLPCLLSNLGSGPSFMSISLLVLELWKILVKRDWPEIRRSEIPLSDICLICGDWDKLGMANFAHISLYGYSFYRFRVTKGKPTEGHSLHLHRRGWWEGGGGGVGLSHFPEGLYWRDLGQIGILGGSWHFRWWWFFSGDFFQVGLENSLSKK